MKNFKNLTLIIPALLLAMASFSGCEKTTFCGCENNNTCFDTQKIFELKYGDIDTLSINDEEMTFSIKEVVDSLNVNCMLADFISQEDMYKVRIHVYLNFVRNGISKVIKVSSNYCGYGGMEYIENQDNIAEVMLELAEWKNSPNKNYYGQEIVFNFGDGTPISDNLFIHIAKAYPILFIQSPQEDYKFIFLISNF